MYVYPYVWELSSATSVRWPISRNFCQQQVGFLVIPSGPWLSTGGSLWYPGGSFWSIPIGPHSRRNACEHGAA